MSAGVPDYSYPDEDPEDQLPPSKFVGDDEEGEALIRSMLENLPPDQVEYVETGEQVIATGENYIPPEET